MCYHLRKVSLQDFLEIGREPFFSIKEKLILDLYFLTDPRDDLSGMDVARKVWLF